MVEYILAALLIAGFWLYEQLLTKHHAARTTIAVLNEKLSHHAHRSQFFAEEYEKVKAQLEALQREYIEAIKPPWIMPATQAGVMSESLATDGPMSVREADRIAAQRRATVETITRVPTTDRMPVPIADREAAPPARVTERDNTE